MLVSISHSFSKLLFHSKVINEMSNKEQIRPKKGKSQSRICVARSTQKLDVITLSGAYALCPLLMVVAVVVVVAHCRKCSHLIPPVPPGLDNSLPGFSNTIKAQLIAAGCHCFGLTIQRFADSQSGQCCLDVAYFLHSLFLVVHQQYEH